MRWLFVLIFLFGLVLSAGFGLSPAHQGYGWPAAGVLSIFGLAWVLWGEGHSPERPAAREAESKALTFAQADQAMLRIDNGMIVGYANSAAERMFGFGAGELSGMSLAKLVPAPERPATAASREPSAMEEYFDRAPLPLVFIDREGCITRMNRAAEAVTEFAAAELRSQPYWEIFLAEAEAAEARDQYLGAMLERNAQPRRETWRTRMGAHARFEWWRTVLQDEFGQAAGVIAAALPVDTAGPAVDLAALADQLTAVNGYSEMLLMSMDHLDPLRTDVESIHRAGMAASSSLR